MNLLRSVNMRIRAMRTFDIGGLEVCMLQLELTETQLDLGDRLAQHRVISMISTYAAMWYE